jgi:hypothetical protein
MLGPAGGGNVFDLLVANQVAVPERGAPAAVDVLLLAALARRRRAAREAAPH